jgi:hypothetical protein
MGLIARATPAAHKIQASALRWPLAGLCTLLALDIAILVFQEPIRRMTASSAMFSPSLIAQPRLNAPSVRAPWQETLEAARLAGDSQKVEVALQKLAEAESQIPQQPFALAELATQYERLGAREKALGLWTKIRRFGPQAGVYNTTAEAKMAQLADASLGADDTLKSAHTAATQAPGPAKPSSAMKFGKFAVQESPGSTAPKKQFKLSMPVINLHNAPIEAKDVAIEVQFYDQTRDKKVERTNATITWNWASNPTDWADKSPKTLQVEYRQGAGRSPSEQRSYYGYVASVYYRDKLQDVRAEPARLGQQYPPPPILPKESNP